MEQKKERKDKTILDVIRCKICSGCGACSVVCPNHCISIKYGERFNYPAIDSLNCICCGKCLKVCPSAFLLNTTLAYQIQDPASGVLDCFLVHSKDTEIRINAASGGFVTGLILHMMETDMADGGVVARNEGKNSIVAESIIATDRNTLLSASGSKYAPVTNCTMLTEVLKRSGSYVFVGTPCMVEGLKRLQRYLPKLKDKITLSIGFVCAGMASRLPTRDYIEKDGGVPIEDVYRICYRGNGWPGRFRAFAEDGRLLMDRPLIGGSLTHVVGRDHYLRCENCLDHWSMQADVVVSDPWTDDMIQNETKGWSAIMVRTKRGMRAVESAIASGALIAKRITASDMLGYNKHLIIDDSHPRHSWMQLYQLMFAGRMKYLSPTVRRLVSGKLVGLRTTLKARLNKRYYY